MSLSQARQVIAGSGARQAALRSIVSVFLLRLTQQRNVPPFYRDGRASGIPCFFHTIHQSKEHLSPGVPQTLFFQHTVAARRFHMRLPAIIRNSSEDVWLSF